eukprot:TRINITY_DN48978_c0_g1_i1.p1 TRINITY_DN48978_c0_g1~~TRINITY_DN48978_c0_g1_i1.p1  ORF type:complete len:927 (+),score=186.79 TRINITY_DN48978_c0_g1_i1:142-2922(+)
MADEQHNEDPKKPRKKPEMMLCRYNIIRKIKSRQQAKAASPLAMLQEVFEEATRQKEDKKNDTKAISADRFVGDTMFWKYFEDICVKRIKHTDSVEYRNLFLMFWETVFFCVVLLIFMLYAFSLQSSNVYEARQEQVSYWSGCDDADACSLHSVNSMDSFWQWMRVDLIALAFTKYATPPQRVADIVTKLANNDFPIVFTPRFVGSSRSSVLLGTIRIRQVRVKKNQGCKNSKLISHVFPDCYAAYTDAVASKESFASRFAPTYLMPAFDHEPASVTYQLPLRGTLSNYAGDGFMIDLPANDSVTLEMINDLRAWRWHDQATRAVIVELSTLNINVNVIVNTRILFEFGPTGRVISNVYNNAAQVHVFTPSTRAGAPQRVYILQILLFIAFTFYLFMTLGYMYKTCVNFIGQNPAQYMLKLRCKQRVSFVCKTLYHYFGYGWNQCDIAILTLYYVHMGYRFASYTGVSAQEHLKPHIIGHPEKFMPFAGVMQTNSTGNNVLALLAIAMWVKPFKYLCMVGYFRRLSRIMERCVIKLTIFSIMLLIFIFGFAVSFFVLFGSIDQAFSSLAGSFLVLFFLLLDGYAIDGSWFLAGRLQIMPLMFFTYIVVVYFVLLNIFIAVVLDAYATSNENTEAGSGPNPMAEFVETYISWAMGVSLLSEEREKMSSTDLSKIRLELLPGLVRRKFIEKKKKMQAIASECFAGLELFPGEDYLLEDDSKAMQDWALPASRVEMCKMRNPARKKLISMYDIPKEALQQEVSREQLQRLMDEDPTLKIVLDKEYAVDVIRYFKQAAGEAEDEAPKATQAITDEQRKSSDDKAGKKKVDEAAQVKNLQTNVFKRIDQLEASNMEDKVPEVKCITDLANAMSNEVTTVRNQFRMQLPAIIEATAALSEHLVDVTESLDAVRVNHVEILNLVRDNMDEDDD